MTERRFRREVRSLEAVFAFVQDFVATQCLPEPASLDLELIAEELFTNCVKYGGGSGDIELRLTWTPPVVILQVVDQGAQPFNPAGSPDMDVNAPLEARRGGGMGLHMVRRIADRIDYAHRNGASTVTVSKRLEA